MFLCCLKISILKSKGERTTIQIVQKSQSKFGFKGSRSDNNITDVSIGALQNECGSSLSCKDTGVAVMWGDITSKTLSVNELSIQILEFSDRGEVLVNDLNLMEIEGGEIEGGPRVVMV